MTDDPITAMRRARVAVQDNLRALCCEILIWRATGVLPEGELRKIAETLKPITIFDHIGMAEKLVVDAALAFAASFAVDQKERSDG